MTAQDDPDALYRNRASIDQARAAAAIWESRLKADAQDFESAWKLARVCYWLGNHEAQESMRRTALERGITAGRQAVTIHGDRPEGHFWIAANMGTLAESFGLRQGLKYRGTFDGTPDVVKFAETLEKVCVETVESGKMTKDLAILIDPSQPYLNTQDFLNTLDVVGYNDVDRWHERRELYAEQDRHAHPGWKMIGTEMGARVPERTPSGWCSWYYFYTQVTETDVVRNLRFLESHRREPGVGSASLL